MKTLSLDQHLGEILVRSGACTTAQLENALSLQASSGRRIGEILVDDLKALSRERLLVGLLQQYASLSSAELVSA